jgi:hypothetical protein
VLPTISDIRCLELVAAKQSLAQASSDELSADGGAANPPALQAARADNCKRFEHRGLA